MKNKFDRSVSMLTWGYNEEELVGEFLDRAIELLENSVADWELIFVDDGSTDCTGEIVQARVRLEPRLRLITNPKNLNIGLSARKALAAASKEYLFWQTVDWSYDISRLRIYLELLKHFDVVTGVRPTPERILSHIPLVRSVYRVKGRSDNLKATLVSLGNYYAVRFLFGIPLHDVQNVGIYPTRLIHGMDLKGQSSFLGPEIIAKAMAGGARYIEAPIPFLARTAGQSKGIKASAIYRSIYDLVTSWIAWGWRLRPVVSGMGKKNLRRVSAPFFLDEDIVRLVAPLLKLYR